MKDIKIDEKNKVVKQEKQDKPVWNKKAGVVTSEKEEKKDENKKDKNPVKSDTQKNLTGLNKNK